MILEFLCWLGLAVSCVDTMPAPPHPAAVTPPALTFTAPAPPELKIQAPQPPSVWPVECKIVPPEHLQHVFLQAVQRHGGGTACQAARQACIEERSFNPTAVNPVSGTIGIGQFKPETAAEFGINPYDAVSSIYGLARYRQWCSERWTPSPAYGRTELDDEALTVACHNRGIGKMRQSQEAFGWGTWAEAEPYQPHETQEYVRMQTGDDVSWCPFARSDV